MGQRFIIFLLAALCLSSCIPNKKVVYFQDASNTIQIDSIVTHNRQNYKVLEGDNLDIRVKSKDPVLSDIFLMSQSTNSQNMMQGAQNGSDIFYLSGYTVNSNGDIELPIVGVINVAGKTLEEIRPIIKARIAEYIIDPYVEVKMGGIRFTALGEFNQPGRYGILQSGVTIYEAIANAGDLSIIADRKHATLIRQYPDGERIHVIDLTDRNLMSTPYYYVQPNDLLYLPPMKVREWGTGITGFQTFAAIVTTVSGVFLLLNLFRPN